MGLRTAPGAGGAERARPAGERLLPPVLLLAVLLLAVLLLAVLLLASGSAAAGPATAPDRYVGVIVASDHIGTANLNNINPGLTYGRRWRAPWPGVRWFCEAGVFRNSYDETAPLVLIGAVREVGHIGPATLRVGAGVGPAYYKTLAAELQRDYGIPNIAGVIPIAAASVSAQVGRLEYRLTTVPAGRNVKAIVNFSLAVHF